MSNLLVQNIKHTNGTTAQSVDSTGRITLPNIEAFYAINPSAQTISNQTWSKVNVTSTQYSRGTGWNTSDARYTAPITGLYSFTTSVNFTTNTGAGAYNYTEVRKNGSVEYYTFGMKLASTVIEADSQMVGTVNLLLNSGDYVEMWAYQDKGSGSPELRSSRCSFSGYLIG